MTGAWRIVCRKSKEDVFGLRYVCTRRSDGVVSMTDPITVSHVEPSSPAFLGGIRAFDEIVAVTTDWLNCDVSVGPSDELKTRDFEGSLKNPSVMAFLVYVSYSPESEKEALDLKRRLEYFQSIRGNAPEEKAFQSAWLYEKLSTWENEHDATKAGPLEVETNANMPIASLLNASSPTISPLESPANQENILNALPVEANKLFSSASSVVATENTQVTISMQLQPTPGTNLSKEASLEALAANVLDSQATSSFHVDSNPKESIEKEPIVSEKDVTKVVSNNSPQQEAPKSSVVITSPSQEQSSPNPSKSIATKQTSGVKRKSSEMESKVQEEDEGYQSPVSSDDEDIVLPIALPPTWQAQIKQGSFGTNCEVQVARSARIVVASTRIPEGTELFL